MGNRLIEIQAKSVELEDKTVVSVEPFAISEHCVSIGWFRVFQQETGYVSAGERNGRKVFYLNELVEHFSEEDRLSAPAFCTSFLDACAFCEWSGFRLPTESEWLAAAVLDGRVYDSEHPELNPWLDGQGLLIRSKAKKALVLEQNEWTSTRISDGRIVVRGGPAYFREVGWQEEVGINRQFLPPDAVELMNSFRVCRT